MSQLLNSTPRRRGRASAASSPGTSSCQLGPGRGHPSCGQRSSSSARWTSCFETTCSLPSMDLSHRFCAMSYDISYKLILTVTVRRAAPPRCTSATWPSSWCAGPRWPWRGELWLEERWSRDLGNPLLLARLSPVLAPGPALGLACLYSLASPAVFACRWGD